MGSSEGLSGWNKNTKELTTYTTADGLPSNTIYAIQGDGKDFLWISTNAGISQFQKKNNKFMSATDYREMSSTRMPPSKINKVLSGLAE